MIVCNGAGSAIAVRPFADGHLAAFEDVVKVLPGQELPIPCQDLSGLSQPSDLVLVRDWGPPSIVPDEKVPLIRLWPDSAGIYKTPVSVDPPIYEGFLVTFWEVREKIRSWPTEKVTVIP